MNEMKLRAAQCKILKWLSCAKVSNNPKSNAKAKLTIVKPNETGNPAKIDGIDEIASGASKKLGIERYSKNAISTSLSP